MPLNGQLINKWPINIIILLLKPEGGGGGGGEAGVIREDACIEP